VLRSRDLIILTVGIDVVIKEVRSIRYDTTGVDKGGGGSPPNGRARFFFVKIDGLLEPVVLNLSFRVRSYNAMFTSERRY